MTAKTDEPVVGVSYSPYRKLMINVAVLLQIDLGLTPHSPPSGFVIEATQDGNDFVTVKEGGRWVSDASLRQYVNMVAVAMIEVVLQTQWGLSLLLKYAAESWLSFLPRAGPYLALGVNAAAGLRPRPRPRSQPWATRQPYGRSPQLESEPA